MPENKHQFYVTTQLSENMAELPSGYLLCTNVPITRTGEFLYKGNELIGADSKPLVEPSADGVVRIQRDEDQVFAENTIKSFEGMPLTIEHPQGFVGPDNWQELSHGTIQNVRRGSNGSGDLLLADILVTTKEAIDLIKGGQRELSCGYDAEYSQLAPGIGKQTDIMGNHVALVSKGRAGSRCKISDEEKACTGCGECTCGKTKKTTDSEQEANMTVKEKFMKFFDSLGIQDEEAKETEEEKAAREKKEKEAAEAEAKKTKDDDQYAGLDARLKKIEDMLAELLSEENSETEETEDADETDEEKKAREKKEKEAEEAKEKKEKEEEEAKEKKKEEAEEKKTEDAWPDLISHADILVPGISLRKPTKDRLATMDSIKAEVLEKALAGENKAELAPILGGKDLRKLTTDALDMAFVAASATVAAKRNSKIQTKDGSKLKVHDFATARTVADINKANKDFYGKQETK